LPPASSYCSAPQYQRLARSPSHADERGMRLTWSCRRSHTRWRNRRFGRRVLFVLGCVFALLLLCRVWLLHSLIFGGLLVSLTHLRRAVVVRALGFWFEFIGSWWSRTYSWANVSLFCFFALRSFSGVGCGRSCCVAFCLGLKIVCFDGYKRKRSVSLGAKSYADASHLV
jgi:hypothetical protein